MAENVIYRQVAGVCHLELNRPAVSNAVDLSTAHELDAAIDRAASDDSVRAVLVTGAGKRFCAGGDVAAMVAAPDRAAYVLALARALDGALQKLAALDKPTVAAVQGAVAGAGLAVMLSCDVIVAAESTRFVTAYSGVGLTPDCGVSYLLPRAIGQQRALALALTNRALSAREALEWGLVTEVVEDAALEERAAALAARTRRRPVLRTRAGQATDPRLLGEVARRGRRRGGQDHRRRSEHRRCVQAPRESAPPSVRTITCSRREPAALRA